MYKAAIIGANGYTGLELATILLSHKDISIEYMVSRSMAGRRVTDLYPTLYPLREKCFDDNNTEKIANDADIVFLCLPHTQAIPAAEFYARKGVKVVDLSADFRYDDVSVYEKWYKCAHTDPELNKRAVYGLPELYYEKIAAAQIVANPGCYVTSAILPLYPLLAQKLIDEDSIIIDSKSGVSGAGRKVEDAYLFTELTGNFKAYSPGTHRHTSEIEEKLSHAAGRQVIVSFTPHLLPVSRGILSTIYGNLKDGVEEKHIKDALLSYYGDKQFVSVEDKLPQLKDAVGSNMCRIGFTIDKRVNRVILVSVLDNLIKGASGQAVQNANIMLGLPEGEGLHFLGRYL
ncbi:MAG: N-acetyl-gamma-glutamyl-phosphate reductase [Christensenellales bacterium]|jgi:N-acetyl-gamma-glutamyl-phosphate reductase